MLTYPHIDPVIVRVGPFKVRWYGMMYVIGFVLGLLIMRRMAKEDDGVLSAQDVEDLLFYLIFGVLIGGRLGYILFYNLPYYLHHPSELLAFWHGGMSFHGGLIGTVVAGYIFARRRKVSLWRIADYAAIATPPGLGLGRIGNFINGELFGRVTTVPWAMVFPRGGPLPRHPSQLYEAFLEGPVLFLILWLLRKRSLPRGGLLAVFVIGYGVIRFCVEFFREPDPQLGFVVGPLTMGQVLSLFMVICGVLLWIYLDKNRPDGLRPSK
jgi:phosphatidylglycerol:prolipoprotein diacylglycerol transferase